MSNHTMTIDILMYNCDDVILCRWRTGGSGQIHIQPRSQQVQKAVLDSVVFPQSTFLCIHCFYGSFHLCRLSSTASGSDALFGPPLESAFKSHSFAGREQLQNAFAASECKSPVTTPPPDLLP